MTKVSVAAQVEEWKNIPGFGWLDTPEEIKQLGCSVDAYRAEVEWLERLHAKVIHWQNMHRTVGCGRYIREVPAGRAPDIQRSLTGAEFKRVLASIGRLGLIVSTANPSCFDGVGYWLYANPFRDLLASGTHKGQVGKPQFIFLLHDDCITAGCIKDLNQSKSSEDRVTRIYRVMHPISHAKLNLAWCRYYGFQAVELSSCFY